MYHLIYVVKPKKMSRVSCLASAQGKCRRRPIFLFKRPIRRASCELKRRRGKSHESYAHAEDKRDNAISPHRGSTHSAPINLKLTTPKLSQSCTSLFTNLTSSPGLNAGSPMYGQPSHLNASPKAQFPHDPTLPWTVKSTSARSSACSLARLASALERFAASSALSRSARPQLQSLQARRRLVLGLQASALLCVSTREIIDRLTCLFLAGQHLRIFNGFNRSSSVSSESGSILSARSSSSLLGISISSSSS
jgi:hypothetical protein